MKRVRVFRCARWKQQGFSLMEVSIVTAIVLLIAIVGIPAIGGYVIENKVPKVGEELQRFVASMKINAQGGGVTPYTGLDTGALANALRDSTVLSVQGMGAAASVAHGLGGSGTSGSGVVQVEPASVDGAGMGSAFTLTLTNVSHAACPALASVLQRVSEIISISGSSGAKVVKDSIATPATPYRAAQAQAQCSQGDVNTFVFTAR
ncbi:prepilin-type N-terminal cleavage/methylation domain-containing protein [Achromobacter mucicolens]|uniref:Prepilin-type N-terminal cleavage/methylation domain-containing protein n=1 Tax=Achromobacter mucicolens TaxID=1389922 RepID=A0ABD4YXQ7_9BURK|nr:type 4 pilus major pilin [Achromobacter mucicolens]MDH1179884.1 prepilin-type N-terminal cleavage/methylation domain-containing protein [Achromobacter mucicolens]